MADIIPFDEREGSLWYDGKIVPWREAKTHVLTHGLHFASCVFEGERIWEAMFALTHMSRDRKVLMEAIACVDCAVWDLVGKALGKSVSALLGGYRKRLPIISIGGYYYSTEWAYVLAFTLFIVLMFIRPRGILAR